MADFTSTLTRYGTDLYKYIYRDMFTAAYKYVDGTDLIAELTSAGTEKKRVEGKFTWYLRNGMRATLGYANPTTKSLEALNNGPETGKTISAVRDYMYLRSEIASEELFDTNLEKFVDVFTQIGKDQLQSFRHTFPANLLRDGTGNLSTYNGAGVGPVADGGTVTLENMTDVIPVLKNQLYSVYAADGTTLEASALRLVSKSTQWGPGTLVFTNESGGNVSITAGATVRLVNSVVSGLGMGFNFAIANSAEFPQYPRSDAGTGYVAANRASYPEALEAIVFSYNNQTADFNLLDNIHIKLIEEAKTVQGLSWTGNPTDKPWRLICSPRVMQAFGASNRAWFRPQQMTGVQGRDDMSLWTPIYDNVKFIPHLLQPADKVYCYLGEEFALDIEDPQPLPGNNFGMFNRPYAGAKLELVSYLGWQFLGFDLKNAVKVTDVAGFTPIAA